MAKGPWKSLELKDLPGIRKQTTKVQGGVEGRRLSLAGLKCFLSLFISLRMYSSSELFNLQLWWLIWSEP